MSLGRTQEGVLIFTRLYLIAAHPISCIVLIDTRILAESPLPQRYHEKISLASRGSPIPVFVHLSNKARSETQRAQKMSRSGN